MIRIENKRTYKGPGFYIGRPCPLGNPFPVDAKTSRDKAIRLYREWLKGKLLGDNPTSKAFMVLVNYYQENGELTLICWCAPLQCHAEVIREFILAMFEKEPA